MADFYKDSRNEYTIMHVVEAFGAGVGHSIHQIYSGYHPDIKGVVVHGSRDFNVDLFEKSRGVRFIKWGATREISFVNDFAALVQLVSIIREIKPTLIHLHSSKAGVLGRVAARMLGIPCLYTPHSYSFLRSDVSPLKRCLFRFIEKILASSATTIACGLEEFSLAQSFSCKSTLVENGVNADRFKPRQKGLVKKGRKRIISVGRISPQKDFEFFKKLAASKELSQFDFLWITGAKDDEAKIADNFFVYGERTPDELADLYRNSDIYLSTALWEGLSRAALEASLSGLPLVLRDCPGNRELLFRLSETSGFTDMPSAIACILKTAECIDENCDYGLGNHFSGLKFYSHNGVQARIRSIYDGIAFDQLVLRKK